jgi:hypothetical protein
MPEETMNSESEMIEKLDIDDAEGRGSDPPFRVKNSRWGQHHGLVRGMKMEFQVPISFRLTRPTVVVTKGDPIGHQIIPHVA